MSVQHRSEEAVREAVGAWRSEHEELERQMGALESALQMRDGGAAQQAFEVFRASVLEHLRVEEELAFPLAERTLPGGLEPIRSLRLAHKSYREDLTEIGSQIARSHFGAALTTYRAFLDSFRTHERLEDQLLKVLDPAPSA